MDLAKKRRLGVATVIVVALVGTGAALGSSQLSGHTTSRSDSDHARFWFGVHGQASAGGLHGWLHSRRHFEHGRGDILAAAASYLGISTDTLRSDLKGGKTLAEIANATSGKSAAGLIDALVSHVQSKLDAAVKAGKLTQAQEDTITPKLKQRITDLVNGTFKHHDHWSHGHELGHDGAHEFSRAARI